MKQVKQILGLGLSSILLLQTGVARAADPAHGLPLVFDAQTKKYFIGGNSKFLLKAGEQSPIIDRIEVAVDNGDYMPYGQAIEFKEEGKHALKFKAITPVNNWSPVQFMEVFVDLTPPVTEAKIDRSYKDEKDLFVGLNAKINLSAQDNLSGIATTEYSWDGNNFLPYTGNILANKAGRQTLYYRSVDRVGNREVAKKIDFVVDANAPNSELHPEGNMKPTVLNGKTYVSDGMSFAITATDELSKVKQIWTVVDGKEQPYIKPIFFLKEGEHTIEYYSVDNVGNKEASKKFTVYTVSTPPQTTLHAEGKSVNTGGVNYASRDHKVKLQAKDNIVGVDHIEVKIDGDKDFKPYFEPLSFNTTGMHTISYRAVDRAGNMEPAKSYSVSIVDKMPETKLNTAQEIVQRDGMYYSPAPNIVTLNVADQSGVGIHETMVSINDGTWQPYRGPITLNSDAKNYKISYKSVDKLGNEEAVKTSSFHMIRAVPVVDLFVTNGKSAEEQVRTNYLEQAPSITAGPSRGLASEGSKKKAKKKD